MGARDVAEPLQQVLANAGVDQVRVKHRHRLLGRSGSANLSNELREYVVDREYRWRIPAALRRQNLHRRRPVIRGGGPGKSQRRRSIARSVGNRRPERLRSYALSVLSSQGYLPEYPSAIILKMLL